MSKRNASWRMLGFLSLAVLAKVAGAGEARAYVTAYHTERPAARQESEMLPASKSAPQGGKLIRMTTPVYPPAAIQARISGVVIVDARVGADGCVVAVNVVSGPLALRRVAEYAVKRWRYEPSLLNGKPVERVAEVGLRFVLGRY